ncbi:M35 family metallopeptidase [Pseudomonas cichorii]|uniref:M35 family metallopeptidase n=1 Tax=Pseudomonas cichorii TaxID=36746 RepID=UPI001C8A4543|nr:M35 family metallopeptidase [Pseudomonas cichorii]MBX8574875.1 M35 family metallopeptidase [Pseudomonas cichorii]
MSSPPYFFSASLKARFSQSIQEAVSSSRISAGEGRWLQSLVDDTNDLSSPRPSPRVDRLVMDDGSTPNAELAGALLLSNPRDREAPVFLSTLVFGIERFKSRAALLVRLKKRFDEIREMSLEIDVQLVNGPLFEVQMQSVVQQQVQHLDRLSERLHRLPSLQAVLGKALAARLSQLLPGNYLDVFHHPVQIIEESLSDGGALMSRVVGSQTLVEVATHKYAGEEPESGLTLRFLDMQGRILTAIQAQPYVQALNELSAIVTDTYEQLLDDYWNQITRDGRTMRDVAAHALAESLRQTLLTSVAQGSLTEHECRQLRALLPYPGVPADLKSMLVSRLSVGIGDQEPVKLVGVFLIEFRVDQLPVSYLFSSQQGFRRFTDRTQVSEHFSSVQGRAELLRFTSLDDHALLGMQGALKLRVDAFTVSWFPEFIRSIIALQKRNVRYALSLPAIGYQKAPVRIDDALDVRGLLDARLLRLRDSGRWQAGQTEFEALWGRPLSASAVEQGDHDYPALKAWADRMLDLDARMERLATLHAGVEECMHRALDRYLALIGGDPLDVRALWVMRSGPDKRAIQLLSLALERVSKSGQAPLLDGTVLKGQVTALESQPEHRLPLVLLESILKWVLHDFAERYDRQQRDFYLLPIRRGNAQVNPGVWAAHSREDALRLELSLERHLEVFDASIIDMLQQVLDWPLPALREALGEDRVEVGMLSLSYAPDQPPLQLANAFVLYNVSQPDRHVLWTMLNGLTTFNSLLELEGNLLACLTRMDRIDNILELLSGADRHRLLEHLGGTEALDISILLRVVDGNLIRALQEVENQRQQETVAFIYKRAVTWNLSHDLFDKVLAVTERDDGNRQAVNDLGAALQVMIYKAIAPAWVTEASLEDLVTLTNMVQRFYISSNTYEDFLFDVPDIRDHAKEKLSARLTLDFPGDELDPDKLLVTMTHYVAAPVAIGQTPQGLPAATQKISETLTDFAINRFSSIQDGVISVAHEDGRKLSASLTPAYIRDLLESLDVAASYRQLVDSALDLQGPSYQERKKNFAEQIPVTEVLKAFVLKLRKKLSAEGYDFIESVFNMPDGIARLPVRGWNVVLSPLLILPAPKGWEPTPVLGVYVITPQDSQSGPWVVYAPLYEEWTFKEYADQSALVTELCTSETFQAFILERIDPSMRHVYANGGFHEPHLPFSTEDSMGLPFERPLPVTLMLEPCRGNALEYLLPGVLEGFKFDIRQQSVTNAEHRHRSSKYLFGLAVEQILSLVPGRLGALVGVWQSRDLFHSSAVSIGEQRWGKAVSELAAGLSVLIATRQEPHKGLLTGEEATASAEESTAFPEFSWSNNALSEELRSRLSEFEVHDIALNGLRKDEVFNVSRDDTTGYQYAAVNGKVYQVMSNKDSWFIVKKDKVGPSIKLDTNQHWKLQLQGGLKGGGGIVTRIKNNMVEAEVNENLVVDARGMREIRQIYRDRAQCIEQAHAQARRYLENCLDNLNLQSAHGTPDPRVEQIVAHFFDERYPNPHTYKSIKQIVTSIYEELISPSLSPIDSQRYVVGFNKRGNETSSAFVFAKDPMKRIFLTEQYFRVPRYRFKVKVVRSGSFNYGDHYRSTILIHELSHLVAGTEDIAYVDSYAPFIDLLEDAPGYRLRIKNEQIVQQQKSLSYQTDRDKLFKQAEDYEWHDLRQSDAKKLILRITGTSHLDAARDVFYADAHKRTDIMLGNADSVALLITLLGRQRFT